MNLYELIQYIPDFIEDTCMNMHVRDENDDPQMIGKFYLGLNYDYQQTFM